MQYCARELNNAAFALPVTRDHSVAYYPLIHSTYFPGDPYLKPSLS